jgi:hypothetical protein
MTPLLGVKVAVRQRRLTPAVETDKLRYFTALSRHYL